MSLNHTLRLYRTLFMNCFFFVWFNFIYFYFTRMIPGVKRILYWAWVRGLQYNLTFKATWYIVWPCWLTINRGSFACWLRDSSICNSAVSDKMFLIRLNLLRRLLFFLNLNIYCNYFWRFYNYHFYFRLHNTQNLHPLV